MAAKTPDAIERDFQDSSERARRWEDTEPERARQLERDASDARATAYRELAEESATQARTATLSNLKAQMRTKYPQADPAAITGDTEEAMDASAKASQEFVQAQVKSSEEATRAARRANTREAWTGGQNGTRVGVPGGEVVPTAAPAREAVEAAWNRTAEVIQNSRLPGHLRRYDDKNMQAAPPAADPEMAAWQDYKLLHANSGLSFEAFRARNAGKGSFTEQQGATNEDEDRKG